MNMYRVVSKRIVMSYICCYIF